MALAHRILGKFLGIVCHRFPPPGASVRNDEKWNCGRERCPVVILPKFRLPHKFRYLLHAANLRHATNGSTSPPKEGVLRNFFPLKIRRLRPGLNPQTWVLKASTLTPDHRSHNIYIHTHTNNGSGNVFLNNFEGLKVSLPEHKPVYANLKFKIIKIRI